MKKAWKITDDSLKKQKEICIKTTEKQQTTTRGLICPRCNTGVMEIDSLMNLVCKNCGFILGGGFT